MKSNFRAAALAHFVVLVFAVATFLSFPAGAISKYKVLHNFGAPGDGALPYGPPVLDAKGNVYGVTFRGGTGVCSDYGCGMVFKLTHQPNGKWKEKALYEFRGGSDGASPGGALILDSAGDIYGTTNGGPTVRSEVFELAPGPQGWTFSVLYNQGAGPGLVLDKSGNLYGEIGPGEYFDIGAIGELSPGVNGWTYTQLYDFCHENGQCPDGYEPVFPPIWDNAGNLYGTTYYGGIRQPACPNQDGCGVVFKMIPNPDGRWTYRVLHRFASYPDDGQSPAAGLVRDASGNLYGDTVWGGANGQGTIFKMSHVNSHWKKAVLYSFPDCASGCFPGGTLVFDAAGNLYGASSGGDALCGGHTCGVIFKLTPQDNGRWKYSVVHKFNGTDGSFPLAVVVDSQGALIGTTNNGGTYNWGVVFKITP